MVLMWFYGAVQTSNVHFELTCVDLACVSTAGFIEQMATAVSAGTELS